MPEFTYSGTDTRYYPALSLEATPGMVWELAEMPADGRWSLTSPRVDPVEPEPVHPAPTFLP